LGSTTRHNRDRTPRTRELAIAEDHHRDINTGIQLSVPVRASHSLSRRSALSSSSIDNHYNTPFRSFAGTFRSYGCTAVTSADDFETYSQSFCKSFFPGIAWCYLGPSYRPAFLQSMCSVVLDTDYQRSYVYAFYGAFPFAYTPLHVYCAHFRYSWFGAGSSCTARGGKTYMDWIYGDYGVDGGLA